MEKNYNDFRDMGVWQKEDKDNIQKVLNTLIPEYQAEQKNQTAKKN